jgi:hypothetical protein
MLEITKDQALLSLIISNRIGEAIHLNIPENTNTYSEIVSANPSLDLPTWSEIEQEFESKKQLEILAPVRGVRNKLLAECDWTQVSDAPLTEQQKQSWSTYRQELRELTENFVDEKSLVWPVKPE